MLCWGAFVLSCVLLLQLVFTQDLECRDTQCVSIDGDECTNTNNLNRFCATGFECIKVDSTRRNCYQNSVRGMECTSQKDCVGDKLRCNADSSFFLKVGGRRCGRSGLPGDTCEASYDCVSGTRLCVNQRCQGIPDNSVCSGWGSNEDCNPGSFCFSPDANTPGICSPQVSLGGECHMHEDGTANCQPGLVCDATVIPFSFSIGVCKTAYSVETGQPATSDELCRSGLLVAGLCVEFPPTALSQVGQLCAADTDCTAVGTCVCSLALGNNTQRCQLKNEYFLQQPGLETFYLKLVQAISSRKCHFSLEPDPWNCFMREFPLLANRYYCALWLSNFQVINRLQCDTTITDWCSQHAPEISPESPVNSLLAAVASDGPELGHEPNASSRLISNLLLLVTMVFLALVAQ